MCVGCRFCECVGRPALRRSRQIVGFNDDILDIKFRGVFTETTDDAGQLHEAVVNDHIVVATNSPQVRMFDLSRFGCTAFDGHDDIVLAIDVSPDG